MKREIIRDTEVIRVYLYPNPVSKRDIYIMYLYDKSKYGEYKTYILQNGYVIDKIYYNKDEVKFCYKKGYDPSKKINYYADGSKIGLKTQEKLGLI